MNTAKCPPPLINTNSLRGALIDSKYCRASAVRVVKSFSPWITNIGMENSRSRSAGPMDFICSDLVPIGQGGTEKQTPPDSASAKRRSGSNPNENITDIVSGACPIQKLLLSYGRRLLLMIDRNPPNEMSFFDLKKTSQNEKICHAD